VPQAAAPRMLRNDAQRDKCLSAAYRPP